MRLPRASADCFVLLAGSSSSGPFELDPDSHKLAVLVEQVAATITEIDWLGGRLLRLVASYQLPQKRHSQEVPTRAC